MQQNSDEYCKNCGELLGGRYCQACGQQADNKLPSFTEWCAEAVDSLFDIDSKAVRTISNLLLKPGAIAKEYVEGRRTRFLPPFRTFVLVSGLSLAIAVAIGLEDYVRTFSSKAFEGKEDVIAARLESTATLFALTTPFITTIVLKVIYYRRFFQEHLIFSLYAYTGIMLWTIPVSLIIWFFSIDFYYEDAFDIVLLCFYWGIAMRIFYGPVYFEIRYISWLLGYFAIFCAVTIWYLLAISGAPDLETLFSDP